MSTFIDRAEIYVGAGRGGDGSHAMRKEKYVPLGGPWGGDGGRGGDVILTANRNFKTLIEFSRRPKYYADPGDNGAYNNQAGRSGKDMTLDVPIGTLILDAITGEVLADLIQDGQTFIAAKGGRGGRGNSHFKTSTRQAPTLSEKGEPGQERRIKLELKLLADVGLVGFPNAGKSTMLARVSAARPKIAAYPFTTLVPQLGVVRLGPQESFVLADLPGLIEGAHEGAGLGLRFLRHLERTRVLLFLLDGGREEADLFNDLKILESELKHYHAAMTKLPRVVAVSKADLPWGAAQAKVLATKLKRRKIPVHFVSAVTGLGVDKLMGTLYDITRKAPASLMESEPKRSAHKVYRPAERFTLRKDKGAYVLGGHEVEKWVAMTDFENVEALRKLRYILQKIGVGKALRDAGAKEGDTIRVGRDEFGYAP